jgi:flavin reductase (DIM6/NTAB) family NADH-FMN oxidoreductase RutF
MQHNQTSISLEDLLKQETRFRASFINSLSGFKSVGLIGTTDSKQKTNLAIFNSFVHIGANPPYIGFISRPDTVDRHTMSNILDIGFYTINHITEDIYKNAHQTSARFPRETSEFDATGLTAEFKDDFIAPFVKESPIKLGITFKEQIKIASHSTIMIVGEISQVYFPNNCLCEDGFLDIEKAGSITCSGLDSYHTTQRLARLSYAKPQQELRPIISTYHEK